MDRGEVASIALPLEQNAPRTSLHVVSSTDRESLEDLASGRVHFALGFSDETELQAAGLACIECFVDEYIVVAGSLTRYLAERHVVVKPWNTEGGVIDAALVEYQHSRDVALQLPSVMATPFIVANSELLLTVPRRALQLSAATPLVIYPARFNVFRCLLKAFLYRRHAKSSAHR